MINPASYWGNTLQALAYWIAYKQQYYRDHLLTEGAIVGELTQLLSAKIDSTHKLECESLYRQFDDSITESIQCDLVIGKRTARNTTKVKNDYPRINSEELTEAIEVKRFEGTYQRIINDFEKIYSLRKNNQNARLYVLVVGQEELPIKIFKEETDNVLTRNIYSGDMNISVHPRRGKKAFSSKKSEKGVYTALIEVDPK